MASVMAPGTPGSCTPPPRARGGASSAGRPPGPTTSSANPAALPGWLATSVRRAWKWLPMEAAITESMRRVTRVAEVAMVS